MKTEDLISQLAADAAPAPAAGLERRAAFGLVLGGVLSVVIYLLVLNPRVGFGHYLMNPLVAAKTVLPLILAGLALVMALRSTRPAAPLGKSRRAILIVPAAVVALFLYAFVTTPEGQRLRDFLGHSIPVCLPMIIVFSIPISAGLIAAMRQGAATRPALSGALAGLAAAGFATALYSTFCTEDSPLFYGVWYSLGIGIATGIGSVLGARMLRW